MTGAETPEVLGEPGLSCLSVSMVHSGGVSEVKVQISPYSYCLHHFMHPPYPSCLLKFPLCTSWLLLSDMSLMLSLSHSLLWNIAADFCKTFSPTNCVRAYSK